jgi:hypothetical protein
MCGSVDAMEWEALPHAVPCNALQLHERARVPHCVPSGSFLSPAVPCCPMQDSAIPCLPVPSHVAAAAPCRSTQFHAPSSPTGCSFLPRPAAPGSVLPSGAHCRSPFPVLPLPLPSRPVQSPAGFGGSREDRRREFRSPADAGGLPKFGGIEDVRECGCDGMRWNAGEWGDVHAAPGKPRAVPCCHMQFHALRCSSALSRESRPRRIAIP